jgi:hypothetical protein
MPITPIRGLNSMPIHRCSLSGSVAQAALLDRAAIAKKDTVVAGAPVPTIASMRYPDERTVQRTVRKTHRAIANLAFGAHPPPARRDAPVHGESGEARTIAAHLAPQTST